MQRIQTGAELVEGAGQTMTYVISSVRRVADKKLGMPFVWTSTGATKNIGSHRNSTGRQ